jgi:3-oxoadipate enol-lactonase
MALDIKGIYIRDGVGAPVVLLHPLGADLDFWRPVAARLDGHACYALDLPGHGSAAVPDGGYSLDELADEVACHLAAQGIHRAQLVGLSLGGIVALRLAITRPDLVSSLVVADAVARYPDDWPAQWHARAARAREQGVASMREALISLWLTPASRGGATAADSLGGAIAAVSPGGATAAETYADQAFARMSDEGYALACELLADVDLRAGLAQIAGPTLVLCGAQDAPMFRDAADGLAAAITGAELGWIPAAAHASALEQPAEFASQVAAFLAARGKDPA